MSAKIKKRQTYHHYRPKGIKPGHFNRVYWPYLPLLLVASGLTWYGLSHGNFAYAYQYGVKEQPFNPQIALLPVTSKLAAIAIWSVLIAAIGTLIGKHFRQIKRSFMKGEKYVLAHPAADVFLIAIIALAFLISQTSTYTF